MRKKNPTGFAFSASSSSTVITSPQACSVHFSPVFFLVSVLAWQWQEKDVKSSHGSRRCAAHSFTCPHSLFFSFVSSLEPCCSLVEQTAGCLVNWTGRSVLLTHSLPLSERIVMGASFLTAFRALTQNHSGSFSDILSLDLPE